jgi:hypothetical protein
MIPAATIGKIAKLIPLLASNHDGEVVATARAITRALKADKRDLHDLVKALEEASARRGYAAPARPDPKPSSPSSSPPKKPKSEGRPTTNLWRVLRRGYRLKWLDTILQIGDLEGGERELLTRIVHLLHGGVDFSLAQKDERMLYLILERFPSEIVYK